MPMSLTSSRIVRLLYLPKPVRLLKWMRMTCRQHKLCKLRVKDAMVVAASPAASHLGFHDRATVQAGSTQCAQRAQTAYTLRTACGMPELWPASSHTLCAAAPCRLQLSVLIERYSARLL